MDELDSIINEIPAAQPKNYMPNADDLSVIEAIDQQSGRDKISEMAEQFNPERILPTVDPQMAEQFNPKKIPFTPKEQFGIGEYPYGKVDETGKQVPFNDDELMSYLLKKEVGGADKDAYTIENKSGSGAYGRYQIMPDTRRMWQNRLKMTTEEALSPEGQDRMMKAMLEDYKKSITKVGKPITPENVYTVHQLGATGFKRLSEGQLHKTDIYHMYKNLTAEELKGLEEKPSRTLWKDKNGKKHYKYKQVSESTAREIKRRWEKLYRKGVPIDV